MKKFFMHHPIVVVFVTIIILTEAPLLIDAAFARSSFSLFFAGVFLMLTLLMLPIVLLLSWQLSKQEAKRYAHLPLAERERRIDRDKFVTGLCLLAVMAWYILKFAMS